jgi:hypothetical protein
MALHASPLFISSHLMFIKVILSLLCLLTVSSLSVDRRKFWNQVASAGTLISLAQPAFAANSQDASDKDKIVKGYQRLTYLLDNWDMETTICGRNDNPYNPCERSPIKVMEYLGYKDTNDPLFKVEKTLMRLQAEVPREFDDEFQTAMEQAAEAAEEGSGMAYISSWGEANPGGGKDRVELFIERSKNDVIAVRDSLATVIRILDLKP